MIADKPARIAPRSDPKDIAALTDRAIDVLWAGISQLDQRIVKQNTKTTTTKTVKGTVLYCDRSLRAETNATVELYTMALSGTGAFELDLAVACDEVGYQFGGILHITGYPNCTGGDWQLLNGIRLADATNTPTFGIEMSCNATTLKLRVRMLRTVT